MSSTNGIIPLPKPMKVKAEKVKTEVLDGYKHFFLRTLKCFSFNFGRILDKAVGNSQLICADLTDWENSSPTYTFNG